ncbi:MAG: hypothetical protein AABX11_00445 [Nanoarchaeota archaeon]
MPSNKKVNRSTGLDERGLPKRAGVFEYESDKEKWLVQVYPYRGNLCCFFDDISCDSTRFTGEDNTHIPVKMISLKFTRRIANLNDPRYAHLN